MQKTATIVLGAVSHGAEVIADGNVHIYGTLRGRAIAGAQGHPDTSIFCQSLRQNWCLLMGVIGSVIRCKANTGVKLLK